MIWIFFFLRGWDGIAQSTTVIFGRLVEAGTQQPVIGASIFIPGTDPVIGASTDMDGYFRVHNVPVGRIDLKITSIGYEEIFLRALTMVSGKEFQLMLEMQPVVYQLGEIVIKPSEDRFDPGNENILISGRAFDPELTSRFAGSRNDPARMAMNFAGVSGANDGRNDLIIRGNSPAGVLWRVEGIDVPNPNHFSSFGSTGGPVSILNYNTLSKSDFITAAFPAEYGNALSGVFDLGIRDGNFSQKEFLGQIGFNGLELGAEGPISSKRKSTYLANFRYSTLEILKQLGVNFGAGTAVPEYRDLSFKVSFPISKGKISLWGLGGISDVELLGSEINLDDPAEDLFGNENQDIVNKTKTGIAGIVYVVSPVRNSSLRISGGFSHQTNLTSVDSISPVDRSIILDYAEINNRQNKWSLHASWYQKLSAVNNITGGVIYEYYDVLFGDSVYRNSGNYWDVFRDLKIKSGLVQTYINWQYRIKENLTLNTGLHLMHFVYNQTNAIEPRIGIKYQISPKHLLGGGFGFCHQIQPLPAYATTTRLPDGTYLQFNRSLDLSRSIHYVLSYETRLSSSLDIRTEVYFQDLSRFPVEIRPTSFSMVNTGDDFVTPLKDSLVNRGPGENYGVELTIEKIYSRKYYFLSTVSLFNSRYSGSDGIWRNSAFNSRYVFNFLGGKEWTVGKKENIIAIDFKSTWAGGRYYTPIDLELSKEKGIETRDEKNAYTFRYKSYFRMDCKILFRLNRPRVTHEWALDVQNLTNRKNEYRVTYNPRTGEEALQYQLGIIPIPQYRILF